MPPPTKQVNLGKKGSFKTHPGALHRALGVPEGQKIPPGKMSGASSSTNPRVRRMAASAKGFKAMNHSHGGSKTRPGGFGGPPVSEQD